MVPNLLIRVYVHTKYTGTLWSLLTQT